MEGEILDSETGQQLAAVVQTGKGARFSLEGLEMKDWSSAEAVIKGWAIQFRKALDDSGQKVSPYTILRLKIAECFRFLRTDHQRQIFR